MEISVTQPLQKQFSVDIDFVQGSFKIKIRKFLNKKSDTWCRKKKKIDFNVEYDLCWMEEKK